LNDAASKPAKPTAFAAVMCKGAPPVCSIVYTLHVVNFAHLDALVRKAYDWFPLDKFPDLIEGVDSNGECA